MTKSEFQDFQVRAASSGTTLKVFLLSEGGVYSTYNYGCKKTKAESEHFSIAPISIRQESAQSQTGMAMTGVELPGGDAGLPQRREDVLRPGSEGVLMQVLSQSMS